MNRSKYDRLRGGMQLYPWRDKVSSFVASTGIIPGFRGVEDGEFHAPGANWLGPHTNVTKRELRGDVGTTASDASAKIHDLDYKGIRLQLANHQITPAEANVRIRDSDHKLLDGVRAGRQTDTSLLNALHASVADTGIKVKMVAEDLGLLNPRKFLTGQGKKDPAHRLRLLASKSTSVRVGGAPSPAFNANEKALKAYLHSLPVSVLQRIKTLQEGGQLNHIMRGIVMKK